MIQLIRYSQDVSVEESEDPISFLVFLHTSAGGHRREFRVRVSEDTIQDLVRELMGTGYSSKSQGTEEDVEEEQYEDPPQKPDRKIVTNQVLHPKLAAAPYAPIMDDMDPDEDEEGIPSL